MCVISQHTIGEYHRECVYIMESDGYYATTSVSDMSYVYAKYNNKKRIEITITIEKKKDDDNHMMNGTSPSFSHGERDSSRTRPSFLPN